MMAQINISKDRSQKQKTEQVEKILVWEHWDSNRGQGVTKGGCVDQVETRNGMAARAANHHHLGTAPLPRDSVVSMHFLNENPITKIFLMLLSIMNKYKKSKIRFINFKNTSINNH